MIPSGAVATGPLIEHLIADKEIEINPYLPENVSSNSIDLRLHGHLRVYEHGARKIRASRGGATHDVYVRPPEPLDMRKENPTEDIEIPEEGIVLIPGVLYLGRTIEHVGAHKMVPWFDGRSSVGRLGIHVHCTAGRGDTGWFGTVTLEMHVLHPVRVYAGERICQATFLTTVGEIRPYNGRYQGQVEPTASRFHLPLGSQGQPLGGIKRGDPILCEHANEMPAHCPCEPDCYCKRPGGPCEKR